MNTTIADNKDWWGNNYNKLPLPERLGKLFFVGDVDEPRVESACRRLAVMDCDPTIDVIELTINSGGGSVADGLMLADTICSLNKVVWTKALGCAYSMAFVVLLVGDYRTATRNTSLGMHEIRAWLAESTSNLSEDVDHVKWLQDRIVDLCLEHTHLRSRKKVRDTFFQEGGGLTYFTAQEALELGVIDEII